VLVDAAVNSQRVDAFVFVGQIGNAHGQDFVSILCDCWCCELLEVLTLVEGIGKLFDPHVTVLVAADGLHGGLGRRETGCEVRLVINLVPALDETSE